MIWHEIAQRLQQDFWPFDNSRVGPNLVASVVQFLGVGSVVYVVWPRARKLVNAWLHGHLSEASNDLHAKLDHIILHHPDIPPLPVDPEKPATPQS